MHGAWNTYVDCGYGSVSVSCAWELQFSSVSFHCLPVLKITYATRSTTSTAVAACEVAYVNYRRKGRQGSYCVCYYFCCVCSCTKCYCHLRKSYDFKMLPYFTPDLSYSVAIWWLNLLFQEKKMFIFGFLSVTCGVCERHSYYIYKKKILRLFWLC